METGAGSRPWELTLLSVVNQVALLSNESINKSIDYRYSSSHPSHPSQLPEHLVEDACEVLAAVGNAAPHLLDQGLTYDLMQFFW